MNYDVDIVNWYEYIETAEETKKRWRLRETWRVDKPWKKKLEFVTYCSLPISNTVESTKSFKTTEGTTKTKTKTKNKSITKSWGKRRTKSRSRERKPISGNRRSREPDKPRQTSKNRWFRQNSKQATDHVRSRQNSKQRHVYDGSREEKSRSRASGSRKLLNRGRTLNLDDWNQRKNFMRQLTTGYPDISTKPASW